MAIRFLRLCSAVALSAGMILSPCALPAANAEANPAVAPAPGGLEALPVQIIALEGDAWITSPADTPRTLIAQDMIAVEDVIETGPTTRMLILFSDNSVLTLGPDSTLTLQAYKFSPDTPSENQMRFAVTPGAFKFASGLLGDHDGAIRIETPHALVNIRQSTVWGGMIDDAFFVYNIDGTSRIETRRGHFLLWAGQAARVENMQARPHRYTDWTDSHTADVQDNLSFTDEDAVLARLTAILTERGAHLKTQKPADKPAHPAQTNVQPLPAEDLPATPQSGALNTENTEDEDRAPDSGAPRAMEDDFAPFLNSAPTGSRNAL